MAEFQASICDQLHCENGVLKVHLSAILLKFFGLKKCDVNLFINEILII